MQGVHVSEYRTGWTTESLNFSIPLQNLIMDLRISRVDIQQKFVNGIMSDADQLFDFFEEKLGRNTVTISKTSNFNANFWYAVLPHNIKNTAPSQECEDVYLDIGDWYLEHQKYIIEDPSNFAFPADEIDDEHDHINDL